MSAVIALIVQPLISGVMSRQIAQIWWRFSLFFGTVSQGIWWAILVTLLSAVAVRGLLATIPTLRFSRRRQRSENRGPVAEIAYEVGLSRRKEYFKRSVAYRIARTARIILQEQDRWINSKAKQISGRDWNPPDDVQEYLEAGYSRGETQETRFGVRRRKRIPKALELSPDKAVTYLEEQMEAHE